MIKLGFTGTSHRNPTAKQRVEFVLLLHRLKPAEFHHGDCILADEQAHEIVRREFPACRIIIHPPVNRSKRASCQGDETRDPEDYLVRNGHIVNETDALAAMPKGMESELGSGTWSTIRRAQKAGKPIYMLWPE